MTEKRFFKNGGSYEPRFVAVEQKMDQIIASRVGEEASFPTWMQPSALGWVEKNGAILSKTTYAALWSAVKKHAINKSSWDASVAASPIDSCSLYADLGGDNFRLPTVGKGGFSKALGTNGFDIGTGDGGFDDQIQNMTGYLGGGSIGSGVDLFRDMNGVFQGTELNAFGGISATVKSTISRYGGFNFDASRVARTGTETTPQGFYNKVWIFTGNTLSDIPDPTPDWLTQQATNTKAIADNTISPPVGVHGDHSVIKLPNGSMIQSKKVIVPAYAMSTGFHGEAPWKESFKEFHTANWSVWEHLGGGSVAEEGAIMRNGAALRDTTATTVKIDGYAYVVGSGDPVAVMVTGYGTWK